MLEFWKYTFLGIVQGLTEFLPVSSSGHLAIISRLMNLNLETENLKAFFALLHLATFFAVFLFTYEDVWKIISGVFKKNERPTAWRMITLLLFATLPAVVVGLGFESQIDKAFSGIVFPALMLLVTAFFLILADRFKGNKKILDLTIYTALMIGFFQAIAILPGISRSGMTVFAALLFGLSRKDSVRFSFLMSLPVTFGAGIIELSKVSVEPSYAISGFIAAFFAGIAGLWLLKKFVLHGKLRGFAFYCIIVSLIVLSISGGI